MEISTVLLGALALAVAWLAWRHGRLQGEIRGLNQGSPAALQLLQREVQAVRSGLDDRLREHLQQTHELSLRIGELRAATESVEHLGSSLEELRKIFAPPGARGAFGERMLEEALADVLPREAFAIQYAYPSGGARVDAVVFVGKGHLLPIDSKFPLDNFRRYVDLRDVGSPEAETARRSFARDVRNHVDDIAGRYLSADDGALDVALMYIPSESIYHEAALSGLSEGGCTISEYALRKRVIPVSPNTLYAYLAVVRMGLRGYRLGESAREILRHLSHLQADVEESCGKLGTAVKQARHSLANLEEAEGALRRMERRLTTLTAGSEPAYTDGSVSAVNSSDGPSDR